MLTTCDENINVNKYGDRASVERESESCEISSDDVRNVKYRKIFSKYLRETEGYPALLNFYLKTLDIYALIVALLTLYIRSI